MVESRQLFYSDSGFAEVVGFSPRSSTSEVKCNRSDIAIRVSSDGKPSAYVKPRVAAQS